MSLIAAASPSPVDATSSGSSITSNSPASAWRTPSSSSHGSTVARKPIVPKLTANTGTRRAAVAAQRREDRAVAAEHERDVRLSRRIVGDDEAVAWLEPVLGGLVR